MQNLAYKIAEPFEESIPYLPSTGAIDPSRRCAACGEPLFGPDAGNCSWQAWGAFWEITAMTNVEFVCGACGEYLQAFFKDLK